MTKPTISYGQLRQAQQGLAVLALPAVRLPMQGVLRLRRLRRWAKDHLEDIEAVRQSLLDEMAAYETGEDGERVRATYEAKDGGRKVERVRIDPDKGGDEAFEARWAEALAAEVDVPVQLWPSDFGEPARDWDWSALEGVSVTMLVEALGPLVREEA